MMLMRSAAPSLRDVIAHAARLRQEGRAVYGCLLVAARGSTPQDAGALMLLDDATHTLGTVGGGCVEAEVRREAFALLSRDGSGLLRYKLDHDYGWDDGLICGGTIEMAVGPLPSADELARIIADIDTRAETCLRIEVDDAGGPVAYELALPPRERLLIAGAGHVGRAVAILAVGLDFDVTIFDDRAALLEDGLPEGVAPQGGEIRSALKAASIDPHTFCLIVTRGHRHDEEALEAVVGRGARYVGMIGSRRKIKLIFDDLVARGVPEGALADIHAPVGVDVDAVTVPEIAVSIAAELVQVRRRHATPAVRGPLAIEPSRP